jgi:hypothetical protein
MQRSSGATWGGGAGAGALMVAEHAIVLTQPTLTTAIFNVLMPVATHRTYVKPEEEGFNYGQLDY